VTEDAQLFSDVSFGKFWKHLLQSTEPLLGKPVFQHKQDVPRDPLRRRIKRGGGFGQAPVLRLRCWERLLSLS
jgi:hypothetical protein